MVLVALGLYRLEHTELSLIGFFFMFLLSMVVLTGNLTYQTGTDIVYHYNESSPPSADLLTSEHHTFVYSAYEDSSGFFTTHNFGYLLAVLSVIGMIGSFVSIRPEGFFR